MDVIPKAVFTKEFKEEAVKMNIEGGLSITEAARRLSIPKSTLDYWVKKLRAGKPIESLRKHKPVDNEKIELTRLKRELSEVKMERDILKKAVAYFAKESLMKYAFIKNMRLIYPLPVMCRVLSVSKSGYHLQKER